MKKTAVSAVMSLIVLSAFANNEIANAEKFVKENKCKNLITNGSFELFAKKNKSRAGGRGKMQNPKEKSTGNRIPVSMILAQRLFPAVISLFLKI